MKLDSKRTTSVRRGLKATGWLATLALVGYHAWLFAGRLRDASFSQPDVLLRWLLAAALIGLGIAFKRRGHSILRGRTGIIFWLLVILLHLGPLPMPAVHEPASVLTLLPWAFAAALLVAALVQRTADAPRPTRDHDAPSHGALWDGIPPLALRFTPRPPPAA